MRLFIGVARCVKASEKVTDFVCPCKTRSDCLKAKEEKKRRSWVYRPKSSDNTLDVLPASIPFFFHTQSITAHQNRGLQHYGSRELARPLSAIGRRREASRTCWSRSWRGLTLRQCTQWILLATTPLPVLRLPCSLPLSFSLSLSLYLSFLVLSLPVSFSLSLSLSPSLSFLSSSIFLSVVVCLSLPVYASIPLCSCPSLFCDACHALLSLRL